MSDSGSVSSTGAGQAIEIPDADPLKLAFFEQSDLGNAERLKCLAGGKLRWIEDVQCWAWYDGRRFDLERGAIAAQRLAHSVVRHIRDEARALQLLVDEGDEDAIRAYRGPKATVDTVSKVPAMLHKHALKSGSASMTAGMLRQARSDLATLSEDFDTDPLAYNVLNGTIHFIRNDGKWGVHFAPHDPTDMLMQLAEVEYDPDAACPFWEERLAMLTPDGEQLAALRVLYGYTLTGLTSDQAFYVHQGKGGDGKSATHMAIAELHGDYYRHSGVKSFLQGSERGGAEHRSDLVRLKGDIRFVTCDEPKARSVWDGETIKQVTGSLITARGSGERTEVTYKPRFKLFAECNVVPGPPSDDKGFRRRFKLYQWTVSLPEPGQDGHIPIDDVLGRLRGERSGILNWMIAGALQWLETRVVPQPVSMRSVLEDYWADASPLLEWMAEWCDTSAKEHRSYSSDLYNHFKQWCEAKGMEKVMTSTTFGTKLRNMQFAKIKDSKGLAMRVGIRLLGQDERDRRAFSAGGGSAPTGNPADPPPGAATPAPAPPLSAQSEDGGQPAVDDDADDLP